jgi:hypothetical protein
MRKLKLSLDELQVESFHANANGSLRGTVPGNEWTEHADESCFGTCDGGCTKDWGSCNGGCGTGVSCNGTCVASCNGTCAASCNGTCNCSVGCTGYTECNCETWETCPNATVCA